MILSCPSCHARYLVPAAAFAGGARQVRCARCAHEWQADVSAQEAPPTMVTQPTAPPRAQPLTPVVPPKPLPPISEPPTEMAPIPKGSNLPTPWQHPLWRKAKPIALITLGAMVCIALLWLLLARQTVVRWWPWAENIYYAIGLEIHHAGAGLSLQEVKSERRYVDGGMKLVVDGQIRNDTVAPQKVPPILVAALGPDGKTIQSWQIDPPVASLGAKELVAFHSIIHTPAGTVVEINLSFVEIQDE